MNVLLISGSLQRAVDEYGGVAHGCAGRGAGTTTTLYDGLAALPHFNQDHDVEPLPIPVADLRGEVRRADALLFSVPEYAGALPGSFKNLLDWLIGDAQPRSLYEKPVAWINASTRGAVNAHAELRTVLGYAHATIVEAACAHIPVLEAMVDTDGSISDPDAREQIEAALTELAREAEPA